jgi:hypothetical protein
MLTDYSTMIKLLKLPIRILIIIYTLFFYISSIFAQTNQQLVNQDEKKEIVEKIKEIVI